MNDSGSDGADSYVLNSGMQSQTAPRCHTYLEIVKARYGTVAHLVFMLFAFVTNILVGSQLLLGGSAVVTSLTGMPVYAAIFLIPVGMDIVKIVD
jgi:Na+/proline symporter